MNSRPPAVAGTFYPADPGALAALVDSLLAGVPDGADPAAAYVVPHAGYRFSGATAAHVYARLRPDRRRAVVLGPAHYARIAGCVAPATSEWSTPLGPVPIDVSTRDSLVERGLVTVADEPFVREHSIEVQLPFLQRVLPAGSPVLPIAAGPSTVDEVAAVWAAVAGPDTALLCSTDLSHYENQADASAQDARTVESILALAPDRIGPRDACGFFALRGLLGWAAAGDRAATRLHQCTSADSGGGPDRVVGYCAVAIG